MSEKKQFWVQTDDVRDPRTDDFTLLHLNGDEGQPRPAFKTRCPKAIGQLSGRVPSGSQAEVAAVRTLPGRSWMQIESDHRSAT